jgi:hypothetical protein
MNRKVRITPPSTDPFNSMSTWMAQMGGSQGDNMSQPTEEEHIYSIAAEMLSQGIDQDEVKEALTTRGFAGGMVNDLVDSLIAYVEEEQDLEEANYLEDQYAQDQITAEREAAEQQDMYQQNEMYYADDTDQGYAEEDAAMEDIYMRFGGKVPTKKAFVKKQMALKKKQEGGSEQSYKADDTFSEKRGLDKFISAVANNAQQKSEEEMLGQMYDDSYGSDMPEAQFGGARRAQNRMMRRANRMVRQIPMGFYNNNMTGFPPQLNIMNIGDLYSGMTNRGFSPQMPGGIQLANIDVRRTGIFGRPKEYTINFANTPVDKINLTDIIDQEKNNVKEQVKEAEQEEKNKETTTASTENEKVQEELITADKITVSDKPKGSGAASSKPQVKSATTDKWGRPEGDKWYNFDPETKQYITDTEVSKVNKSPFGEKWDEFGEAVKLKYEEEQAAEQAKLAKMDPATRWYYENVYKNIAAGKPLISKGNNVGSVSNTYSEIAKRAKAQAKPMPAIRAIGDKVYDISSKSSGSGVSNIFNNPYLRGINTLFQQGGITGQDLYKFIYGGDDSMIPFADESFRTDSRDTTDPYFRDGGLYRFQGEEDSETDSETNTSSEVVKDDASKSTTTNQPFTREDAIKLLEDYQKKFQNNNSNQNFINPYATGPIYPPLFGGRGRSFRPPGRAIQYAGSWAQQRGLPYDPITGQPIQGLNNPQIQSIRVDKTGLLSNRPKKYTINYVGDIPGGGFGSFDKARRDALTSNQNIPQQPFSKDARIANRSERVQNRNQRRAQNKKIDWSTEDGMISPRDLMSVGNLPMRKLTGSGAAEELRSRQEAAMFGDNPVMPTREPSRFDTIANQNREVSRLAQSEDIDNTTDEENISDMPPMINTAGPRNETFSEDQDESGMDYQIPYSPERQYMLDSVGRGFPPFYSMGADGMITSPEEASTYLDNAFNYNQNLPSPTALPQELITQQMLTDSQNRYNQRQVAMQREAARRRASVQSPAVTPSRAVTPANNVRPENKSTVVKSNPLDDPKYNMTAEEQAKLKRDMLQAEEEGKKNRQKAFKSTVAKIPGYGKYKNEEALFEAFDKGEVDPWVLQTDPAYAKSKYGVNSIELRKKYENWQLKKYPSSKKQRGGLASYQTLGQVDFLSNNNQLNPYTLANRPSAESMMSNPFAGAGTNPLTGKEYMSFDPSGESYRNEGVLTQLDKDRMNKRMMSVDVKEKNMYNVDPIAALNNINAGVGFGLSTIDAFRNRDIQNRLLADLPYMGQTSRETVNRGDYDTNSGLFKPDQMGTNLTRAKKGGSHKEGQVTYMSAKQVQDFIKKGGKVEFI